MRLRSMLSSWLGCAWLVLCTITPVHAQPDDAARNAFRACDAQAFLALNMARNYLMSNRNRGLVLPHVEGSEIGRAMAEDLFDRVERGEIQHPGQFAADTLFKCANSLKLSVGATKEQAAVCFTRTDIAVLLDAERARGVPRQKAVSNVSAKLTVRSLYPMALMHQVAEAVYKPEKAPDVRELMGSVAWSCIHAPAPRAASSASR